MTPPAFGPRRIRRTCTSASTRSSTRSTGSPSWRSCASLARREVDYLEGGGFSARRATAEVWYRLLNTGFRLPAGAGTDAMANFASLHGPGGMNRGFGEPGRTGEERPWVAALKSGRTFASNGPLLEF